MIQPYKERKIKLGQEVAVYRNLHNGLFSIKDLKTGLVLGHGEDFTLANVTVKLSEKLQNTVREQQKKNVHAYLVGTLVKVDTIVLKNEITYNPYTDNSFRFKINNKEFMGAELMYFNKTKCYMVSELKNAKVKEVKPNDN